MEIVNPLDPADFAAWTANLWTTFLQEPDPDRLEERATRWRARLEPQRTWGARDHGRWVATLATEQRRMTVPAAYAATAELTIDALTAVTVNATHRRRGLLSTMLGASLRAAKDRGDAVSYLVAAEWPIYGRFGYAPATRTADYTYLPRSRGGAVPAGPGTVRQAEPAEVLALAPAVFARARTLRAGDVDRPDHHWSATFETTDPAQRCNHLLHEGPQGVDGVLAWRPQRDFELGTGLGAIAVHDLFAATPDAYHGLWSYLSGIDVVDEISLRGRPVDEQVRWLLTDGRALRQTYAGDFTWLCLLDVPAALSARGYEVPGSVVMEVVDPSAHGFAAGRFLLDAGPDGVSCTPTTRSPQVTLSAHALASAYLGGYRLAGRKAVRDVVEETPGSVARLDAMFATALEPWCQSGF